MAPTTQERWSVTLSVGGEPYGVFDGFSGGRISGESRTYHAGGMQAPSSDVSPPQVENITISRGWEPARDAVAERALGQKIGYDCVVGKQALNAARQPIPGALITYRGRIVAVSTPDHDSNGRDFNRFEVEIVVEGLPS